jgi:hypothetical protein
MGERVNRDDEFVQGEAMSKDNAPDLIAKADHLVGLIGLIGLRLGRNECGR